MQPAQFLLASAARPGGHFIKKKSRAAGAVPSPGYVVSSVCEKQQAAAIIFPE